MAKKMKYAGRSKEVAQQVLTRFESGNIAKPLAMVLLSKKGLPQENWSWLNQLIVAFAGCSDARGFGAWKKVGRKVPKGPDAYILAPMVRNIWETDEDTGKRVKVGQWIFGYKTLPVWDVSRTIGDSEIPKPESHDEFLQGLPLLSAAKALGVKVGTEWVGNKSYLGSYSDWRKFITTGVENVQVYLHELVHAGDYANGTKVEPANHWRSEAVAELGACVLANMLGVEDVDEGHAWKYINRQAAEADTDPLKLCKEVLDRVCEVVSLLLEKGQEELAEVAA